MKQIKTIFKLIKVDSKENSNKFWNGIIYDDGSARTEWGRVGYSSQSKDFSCSLVIEKKKNEKLKDGYEELKIVLEGVSNLLPALDQKKSLLEIAKKQIKTSSSKLDDLIQRLVKSNIHNITSSTQLKFDSSTGLFQTPLGVVLPEAITDARDLLVEIKQNYQSPAKLEKLVVKYLRLIPHDIGMKFNVRNIFPDEKQIEKENDILDSLNASYDAIQNNSNSKLFKKLEEKIFDIEIDILQDKAEFDRISKWFYRSNHATHGYKNVKIANCYKLNTGFDFDGKLGNITEVFHSTGEANLLSILKSGLRVSPPATAYISGLLYSSGVYGAVDSSKSLQYTFGRFGGSVGSSGWCFIAEFAMGRQYNITTYGGKLPIGYDSIYAKKELTGLRFDELIVPQSTQVKLKYLLEVTK
jgi:predicted DNA-binding WGR domain protein